MLFENFTDGARRVVVLAQEHARALNHNYIGTEHLLLALVNQDGVAQQALVLHQVKLESVIDLIDGVVGRGSETPAGNILLTPGTKRSLELAVGESRLLHHRHVGTEHILLGLIKEGTGFALTLLDRLGVAAPFLRGTVLDLIGRNGAGRPASSVPRRLAETRPVLLPLAEVARELVPDQPAVGREQEVQRVLQALSRTFRNNPVLVGDTGTGKTSIVHAAAAALASGACGPALRGRRIEVLSPLDDHSVEQLRTVVTALDVNPAPILFVEQLTDLTDGLVSDILAAAMVRGALRVVATATPEQYAHAIARHNILKRLCQPVRVKPMSQADTVAVLIAVRRQFETHHRLSISDEAVVVAAELAGQHIHTSVLPGAAIDLLDKVCSRTSAADGELGPDHMVRAVEDLLAEWDEPVPGTGGPARRPVDPRTRPIGSPDSVESVPRGAGSPLSVGSPEPSRLFDDGPDIWMIS